MMLASEQTDKHSGKGLPQGLCNLCGKRPATTREHIPPQSASNKGEVEINYIDGETPDGTIQFHVICSSNGFWLPSLCEECNNKTGARYGSAYKDFVLQVSNASGLEDAKGRVYVYLNGIHPSRVLKQMFSMFLGAMPYQPAPVLRGIQEFVLRRDALLPPNAPSVYLYNNVSKMGRIVPCCSISELATNTTLVASEISWPPIGIAFSFHNDARFDEMENITNWDQFDFKQKEDFVLKLPRLRVASHYPLSFGTRQESEREQARRKLVYLFYVPNDSDSHANVSALWKSLGT